MPIASVLSHMLANKALFFINSQQQLPREAHSPSLSTSDSSVQILCIWQICISYLPLAVVTNSLSSLCFLATFGLSVAH